MYSTAHRAISSEGLEAIHAFVHVHGNIPWPNDVTDWPETHPGKLALNKTVLPVGGNRIRSYLDVLAPDTTPLQAIHEALTALSDDLNERRNPTVFSHGSITIRFGVEPIALGGRHTEFKLLCAELEDISGRFLGISAG